MLNAINSTIEAVTYGSLILLATQFIKYCWQRAANKSAAAKFWDTIDRDFWQTSLAPQRPEQPEPAAEHDLSDLSPDVATGEFPTDEAVAIVSYSPKTTAQPATLVIRSEPDLSDEALIRWAKLAKFPGSNKWGFNRKLSAKTRSELLALMEG